jgi:hypothetical protein
MLKKTTPAKTPETMREVIGKHLPYEIDRLLQIYELLLDRKRGCAANRFALFQSRIASVSTGAILQNSE